MILQANIFPILSNKLITKTPFFVLSYCFFKFYRIDTKIFTSKYFVSKFQSRSGKNNLRSDENQGYQKFNNLKEILLKIVVLKRLTFI